ncbi:MAG: exonuclease domain-containing protein [Gammaproteobacteria bacterium]|nr:exonuclease domain-containing protein [Gammaproteobacteria bacterium]
MNTLLFYDIESTGLNKCFDQVLQFAAIRTDLELNELERYEIIVKLNPDIIPSPFASITHHVSIADNEQGLNEFEAMQKIHSLLNTPGTISIGYNTLGFDDEFLRFSFYRNLLTPYTHQFANHCRRMDLYPMAIMYHLFKSEALIWPTVDGKVSLKLDQLSPANNLASGPAHTAIVDVEATVELARRFKQHEKMWNYLSSYFDKTTDQAREMKLSPAWEGQKAPLQGLMIYGKFGKQANYNAPVISLGQHHHYRNQTLWLRLDLPELASTTPDSIQESTWAMSKRYGEPGFILPMQEPYTQYLSAERQALVKENLAFLQANPELLAKIAHYHQEFTYPINPEIDIDAALYQNGFLSPVETKLCQKFHTVDISGKIKLLTDFSPNLQAMAVRVLGRHYYDDLPKPFQQQFNDYLTRLFSEDESLLPIDFKQNRRTGIGKATAEIIQVRCERELSPKQEALLAELETYINARKHSTA